MPVGEVPPGKTYNDVRLEQLGVDLTARSPTSGKLGHRIQVVDVLPPTGEQEEGVIYAVRAP